MITVVRKTLLHANSKNYLRKMCKNQTGDRNKNLNIGSLNRYWPTRMKRHK